MPYGTPAEMSPYHNQNKGYAKQERKDLLQDNPVAKDASGGRSWMSKHSKSGMGSPALSHHEKGSMAKKLDPMHNGKPGVQKEDFDQFKK